MMPRPTRILLAALTTVTLLGATAPLTVAVTTLAMPSDFDGDGYADLAIGVPGEDIGSIRDAGMVNVLYGGAHGLSAVGDEAWSQDTTGVLGTSEGRPSAAAGDAFGSSVASADFDRDGRADLAIGVPLDRVGTTLFAGAVNVLYGSSTGLTATGDQLWNEAALPDDPEAGDGFGQSLAIGDFDHDAYPDLAIGVPGETLGDGQAPGMVIVLKGGPDGLTSTGVATLTRASTGVAYDADTSPHGFGYALATGDLDGDVYADLAVGAPASGVGGDDPMRPLVDGEVAVFYGGPGGLATDGSEIWSEDSDGVAGEAGPGEWFGTSLATADFDADGRDDLAVGAPYDRVGLLVAGSVTVLYGSSTGLTGTGSQVWHQDVPGVPGSAEADDDLGRSVAGGHLDGDAYADLAIGVPGEAFGSGASGAGAVNVLYGSASGLSATGAQAWSQASPGVPGTPEATDIEWDAFGRSLAIGDYGHSGRDDLAVGVPLERVGSHQAAGLVNVLYGRTAGLSGADAQAWTQDTTGVQGASESGDLFGVGLTP